MVNSGSIVESGVSLSVGDVLTCSAEGALSYHWTNLHNDNDEETYGKTISISQPGSFNYQCTVFMDCGTGMFCPFSKNISGFAKGTALQLLGYTHAVKLTELCKLLVYRDRLTVMTDEPRNRPVKIRLHIIKQSRLHFDLIFCYEIILLGSVNRDFLYSIPILLYVDTNTK